MNLGAFKPSTFGVRNAKAFPEIRRSRESAGLERAKAMRRYAKQRRKSDNHVPTDAAKEDNVECVQCATKLKHRRTGTALSRELWESITNHIGKVGEREAIVDIENLAPAKRGTASASGMLRALRDPRHLFSGPAINLWKSLAAAWQEGHRPSELRRQGVDLTLNGAVVTVVGEVDRSAPAPEPEAPSVAKPPPEPEPVPEPEAEPEPAPASSAMSFVINEAGLPVIALDGVTTRVAGTPDRPMFCAADACAALGIANSRSACESVAPDEQELVSVQSTSGSKRATFVTEPGLYRLIFKSRKQGAEAFSRWVRHEVLPSIRKTGSYSVGGAPHAPDVVSFTEAVRVMALELTRAFVQEMAQRSATLHPRQEFDSNGFEVPSGEPLLTNKREQIKRMVDFYVAANPKATHRECHSRLHVAVKAALGIEAPECQSKLKWFEEHGYIDAAYVIAYAMFAKKA